jgi:hypothetical protein
LVDHHLSGEEFDRAQKNQRRSPSMRSRFWHAVVVRRIFRCIILAFRRYLSYWRKLELETGRV